VAERTEQLERLTLTDDVTGLFNQRFLFRRLDEEYERARRYEHPLAVMMLDIDYFKSINDNHDHIFGSRVLRRVGGLLREAVRDVDIVVRYGGDEFTIILPETPLGGAILVAERLRARVEVAEVGDEGDPYRLTLSVGVAAVGDSTADSGQSLLRAADRALYGAKEAGRNRTYVARGDETGPA